MFLKKQLSARTGLTLPQIQCGVYQKAGSDWWYPYSSTKFLLLAQSRDRYKIPDVGPVSVEMCQLKKIRWILNVQRLDGTKVPILVPSASEVSQEYISQKDFLKEIHQM